MRILKIGGFDFPQERWSDLNSNNEIFQFTIDERNDFLKPENKILKGLILRSLNLFYKFQKRINVSYFNFIFIKFVVILYFPFLYFSVRKNKFDFIWVSYNDYQDTAFLFRVIFPHISNNVIIRLIKETRPNKNYLEEFSLINSSFIFFNSNCSRNYFLAKYPRIGNKNYQIGVDEDWRSEKLMKIANGVAINTPKLSIVDDIPHLVILAGRVMSNPYDKRSGGRLFYYDMIEKYLKLGWFVHLHTKKIELDENGLDPYTSILKSRYNNFSIEEPLDFINNTEESYSILSRYDFGLLHASDLESNVSKFDEVNIPHRFYEYLISGVISIVNDNHELGIKEIFTKDKYILLSESFNVGKIGNSNWRKLTINKTFGFDKSFQDLFDIVKSIALRKL
jgi:hypothetical protein